MAELKRGKDPECAMFDCPHKKELESAIDELNNEKQKNEELNNRLESVDMLIEQGLVDIKGIFTELFKGTDRIEEDDIAKIINKVERVFDTQKITDIVNENLKLRKVVHQKDLKIMEFNRELDIARQENQSLKDDVRVREELDKNIIRGMRNIEHQAETQTKTLDANNLVIHQQESKLKVLEEFISNARSTIQELKKEHEHYLKELKALKNPHLTREGRKVLKLIKRLKKLKNGSIFMGFNRGYKAKVVYAELKDAYFGLADFEKQKLVDDYDEVAQMMGE